MTCRRDALLLVGHGSGRVAGADRVLQIHAAALRARQASAHVAVGLLNGTPSVTDAVASLGETAVHVVPCFMEDGYFTRVAVPNALRGTDARILHISQPTGTHPMVARIIEQRAFGWCRETRTDPSALSLVLLAHGSARAPGRLMSAHDHARRIAATGRFGGVRAAFLEEPPSLLEALPPTGGAVAVAGLFAGEGGHVQEDLPRLLAEAAGIHPMRVAALGIVGDDPMMQEIILERAMSRGHDRSQ